MKNIDDRLQVVERGRVYLEGRDHTENLRTLLFAKLDAIEQILRDAYTPAVPEPPPAVPEPPSTLRKRTLRSGMFY